jgi:hypothetical protein
MRLARLFVISAATLALASCSGGGGGSMTPSAAPSTTSATHSATAAPTTATAAPTTTTATVDPHPPLASLVITTRGLLPLTISDPIPRNPGAAMLAWNPAICDPALADPSDLGRWISTYPDGGFSVDARADGVIHRIDIWSNTISTPEGVHLGTPLATLLATYPGLTLGATAHDSVKVRWMHDAHGYVVFETSTELGDGTVVPEQVRFIRILDAASDPDYAISNSDNIAGNCI